MAKRIRAISAKVGHDPGERITVPFSLEAANRIKIKLGSSSYLKKQIIYMLLEQQRGSDQFANMWSYLVMILSWNEMHNINFCYEMFVRTRSPVLTDYRVAADAGHLYNALCKISKFAYPQFFKYLAPLVDLHVLNRSLFPTLFTAAAMLKLDEQGYNSVRNFLTAGNPNAHETALALVELHKSAMRENQRNVANRSKLNSYILLEPDPDVVRISRLRRWMVTPVLPCSPGARKKSNAQPLEIDGCGAWWFVMVHCKVHIDIAIC